MAKTNWGRVYFHQDFAGILREDPGGRFAFEYDDAYVENGLPRIAHTLPLKKGPYISEGRLHPYFDNLVAEGWLLNAQARKLGVPPSERLQVLLAFGRDCIGAVSIIDPDPGADLNWTGLNETENSFLSSRASLSGIQRKLNVVVRDGEFWPAGQKEMGTHIAKLASGNLTNLVELEFLSTTAAKTLLPKDKTVAPKIARIKTINEKAFIVKRFDRTDDGKKIHFEEFSQLLGVPAGNEKYDAAYGDIANFIRRTPNCSPAEVEIIFRRILACFITGNTDAHLKNFAMYSSSDRLRLTPAYDTVGSALYPEYSQIALAIGGKNTLDIHSLKSKHILALANECGLSPEVTELAVDDIGKQLPAAKKAVLSSKYGDTSLKEQLTKFMEKRWNGTFASIGTLLSKRQ